MADNVVEIIIRAIDQMSGTLDKIGKSGGDLQTKLVANWKAIGLAAAAAGAGLELLARQQGELSRQTDQAAITTGMTSAEVNQLARDVADASTSIEEALDLISPSFPARRLKRMPSSGIWSAMRLERLRRNWQEHPTGWNISV